MGFFAHANFYTKVKNFIENMGWIGLDLLEKCYNLLLVTEFYSRLLIHANEYENPVRFDFEVLYTYIDGQE